MARIPVVIFLACLACLSPLFGVAGTGAPAYGGERGRARADGRAAKHPEPGRSRAEGVRRDDEYAAYTSPFSPRGRDARHPEDAAFGEYAPDAIPRRAARRSAQSRLDALYRPSDTGTISFLDEYGLGWCEGWTTEADTRSVDYTPGRAERRLADVREDIMAMQGPAPAYEYESVPEEESPRPERRFNPVRAAKKLFNVRTIRAGDDDEPPEAAVPPGREDAAPDAAAGSGGAESAPAPADDRSGKKGLPDGEKSLYDDLTNDMLSVSPDEFSKPEVQEVPFSLRQVAASVLMENRSVKVAAYRPEQAKADILSAKSVYDPELFASWTHEMSQAPAPVIISGMPSRKRDFRNDTGRVGVRQHLPTGGKISAYREWNDGTERNPGNDVEKGHGGAAVLELTQPILNGFGDMENRTLLEISRIQVDITQEEFRQTVMETMAQALEAYWNVASAREELRISLDSFDLAQRLLERELGRKLEGISTQLDVDRAREAVSTRAFNVQIAREQELQAQENLKFLMNNKSVPIGMDIYVDPIENIEMPLVKADLQKSIDVALENRPEILNVGHNLRSSEARQRYAKHTLLPELNLVGSIRRNDKNASTPTTGSDTLNTGTDWSVGMEFAMPIGSMKARSNMRKAEAEVAQLEEEKRNVRDVIITEVRTVVKNMELVVREIPLNKRAVEAAEKVLDGEWTKLELNQTGNRDLLQAQDLVAVTQRNYVNSLIRYNIYIVKLFAAQGVLLEKMGITLR